MSIAKPQVSFVVITHNASKQMVETVRKMQQEMNTDWHCILLDNGSTDDTGILSRKLVDEDSRVRYVYQQKQAIEVAKQNARDVCLFEEIRFIEIGEH